VPGSIDDAIKQLRKLFAKQFELQEQLDGISDRVSSAEADEKGLLYLREIRTKKLEIREYLQGDLLRYPPHHYRRHAEELKKFLAVAPYEQSVFIMTKFPNGKDDSDVALNAVITAVKEAITEAKMVPRIAEYAYHDWLWDNVELYLMGCARGVAIVEDRYRSELNPNVALEWGWMKGMGKKVFFLMEEKFASGRADWQGLLSKTFSWGAPDEGVKQAILTWLQEKEN
jgi:hypothetical protein